MQPIEGIHHISLITGDAFWERELPLDIFEVRQIQHADVQGLQKAIHGFQAETAAGVEEVGKVALLKPGFAGQTGTGQLPTVDSGPDVGTQFVLQVLEIHG